jgi:hypothetical protein
MTKDWTYRRDRWGEAWHIIPAGERGSRGRALCGEPRQGTPFSEGYAETAPQPPELVCPQCSTVAAPRRGPVGGPQ